MIFSKRLKANAKLEQIKNLILEIKKTKSRTILTNTIKGSRIDDRNLFSSYSAEKLMID